MTQNNLKPTAKEAVKEQIASILRYIDRRIAAMTEKMNADFLHFFEWHAEDMFKMQKRRSFLNELMRAVDDTESYVDLYSWLGGIANQKVDLLIRKSLTRNSTSEMANIAHLLNLEVEQELIRDLECLAQTAEYYSK